MANGAAALEAAFSKPAPPPPVDRSRTMLARTASSGDDTSPANGGGADGEFTLAVPPPPVIHASGPRSHALATSVLDAPANDADVDADAPMDDTVDRSLPISLKDADYDDRIGEDPLPETPMPASGPLAELTNQEIYRIIRIAAEPHSGDDVYRAISADDEFETAGHAAHQKRHFGLGFGLALFAQESGRLGRVLQLMKQRDPATFGQIFGEHAEALIAVTTSATPQSRLAPVGGEPLWSPAWIERFRNAGGVEAFQAAQNEEAIEGQFRPILPIAAGLGLDSDRALAMAYDRVVTGGLGGGARRLVLAASPLRTKPQQKLALDMLGHTDVLVFQQTHGRGLPQNGVLGPETHAALVGVIRDQGLLPLPTTRELTRRLVAAATGNAAARLDRLAESDQFTDVRFALTQ